MSNIFKKLFFSILAITTIVGCQKDNIIDIDPVDADNADDYIANTVFSDTVHVYFTSNGEATVTGATDSHNVSVSGNGVTIAYDGEEAIMYILSGTTSNGYFKLYGSHKQGITLDGVTIANSKGAAINVQGPESNPAKGKRTFIVVTGSNTLRDGTSYTNTPDGEDEKATIFGEGKMIFSGDGSLDITAQGKSGVASDDYVSLLDAPTITINSTAGHGIKANDYISISAGTLSISTTAATKKGLSTKGYVIVKGGQTDINVSGNAAYDSDDNEYSGTAGIKADNYFKITDGTINITNSGAGGKGISSDGNGFFAGGSVGIATTGANYTQGSISSKGIKFDGDLEFSGANVTVKCNWHEGIEAKGTIIVSGGTVYSYSGRDDGINSGSDFTISGGKVCGYATSNDGLDANGDFYIKGGIVYAIGSSSPEVAVDANTEQRHKLYVEGGTIVAIGGLENGSSLTQSCYSASWSQNTWYGMAVGSTTHAFKTPSAGGTPLVVSGASSPSLTSGVSASGGTSHFEGLLLTDVAVSGGTSVTLSAYSGGNGISFLKYSITVLNFSSVCPFCFRAFLKSFLKPLQIEVVTIIIETVCPKM